MNLDDLFPNDVLDEDGRIVPGVNTTRDVGPGEIAKQAAKFGFAVTKDGVPVKTYTKAKPKDLIIKENAEMIEGPYLGGEIRPRLKNGKTPETVYRIMSMSEYEKGLQRGSFVPRGYIHAAARPHPEYCEPGDQNALVAISYEDADGWRAKQTSVMGVVAITDQAIPASRVKLIAAGTRQDIEQAIR